MFGYKSNIVQFSVPVSHLDFSIYLTIVKFNGISYNESLSDLL